MNNYKKTELKQIQSKSSIRSKKDDMSNFIESEFNKFKKTKKDNPISLSTKYDEGVLTNDLNNLNVQSNNPITRKVTNNPSIIKNNIITDKFDTTTTNTISNTTYSKFPGFKMPDKNYNSNDNNNNELSLNVSGADFLKSSQSGTRTKTPFVMKKFENLEATKEQFITKEIIDDLNKHVQ